MKKNQPIKIKSHKVVQANTNQIPAHSTLLDDDSTEFSEEKDPLPITAEMSSKSGPNTLECTRLRNQKQKLRSNISEIPPSDIANTNFSDVCEEDLDSKLAEAPIENLTKK